MVEYSYTRVEVVERMLLVDFHKFQVDMDFAAGERHKHLEDIRPVGDKGIVDNPEAHPGVVAGEVDALTKT